PESKYGQPWQRIELQRRVLERLRALPGVEQAAATTNIPWGQHSSGRTLLVEGRPLAPAARPPEGDGPPLPPGHPQLLRIPLVSGRRLEATDDADSAASVAVVSQSAARVLFADEPVIGRRFRFGRDASGPAVTIVGVVGDVYNHFHR